MSEMIIEIRKIGFSKVVLKLSNSPRFGHPQEVTVSKSKFFKLMQTKKIPIAQDELDYITL